MSLNNKTKLVEIAKVVCRDLRKKSTKAERIFWKKVRNKQFNGKKFCRQYPIFHDITGKETFFVADFYCHTDKLIVELDGKYHLYRLKEDEARTKILNHLGLRVIRFSNDEIINDVEKVLLKLKKQDPKTDTTGLEKEIDEMVYKLYGLTEEEIRIVEGNSS